MDHLCGSFAMRKLLPRRELQQLTMHSIEVVILY